MRTERSVWLSDESVLWFLSRKLTKVLKNYVDNAEKLTEQLLKAMKALEYIFKFIVRSRVLFNQYVKRWFCPSSTFTKDKS